jgi:uncharacterized membrane protein
LGINPNPMQRKVDASAKPNKNSFSPHHWATRTVLLGHNDSFMLRKALRYLDQARKEVPPWTRILAASLALALTIATWGPMLLAALGLPAPAWEVFVFDTCEPFCHQAPSRSFHIAGHAFPLCARCTGMWLGITLGIGLAMVWIIRQRWWLGSAMTLAMLAASGLDHLREQEGGSPSSWARAILGFFLFIGLTFAVSFDILALLTASGRAIHRCFRR